MAKMKYTGLHGRLSKMKYKELKAACIMLGMDFDDVHDADVHNLQSYYIQNTGNLMNKDRLEQFEDYTKEVLIEQGLDAEDPIVKFKPFSANNSGEETENEEGDEIGTAKASFIKKAGGKKKSTKKEKDKEFGIFKGTKKALVFQLTKEGVEIKKIIKATLKQFPEAKEKSIKIWNKRAKAEMG